MLAPPFTKETAREKGRKGGINSGFARRAQKEAMIRASSTDEAQKRAKLQVDKLLRWMEKCHNKQEYGALVAMLDRLWDKAFPRQASVKPTRPRGSYGAMPAVVQVQEQVQTPQQEPQPAPKNGQVG